MKYPVITAAAASLLALSLGGCAAQFDGMAWRLRNSPSVVGHCGTGSGRTVPKWVGSSTAVSIC